MHNMKYLIVLLTQCFGQLMAQSVQELLPGPHPYPLNDAARIEASLGNSLLYTANNEAGDNTLFFINGYSFVTSELMPLGSEGVISEFAVLEDYIYLVHHDVDNGKFKLLQIDEDGTLNTLAEDWESIQHLTPYQGKLYFGGEPETFDDALYAFDPSNNSLESLLEYHFFGMEDMLVFNDELHALIWFENGLFLIKSNGEKDHREDIHFLHDGSDFTDNLHMTVTGDWLYFFSTDMDHDYSLYATKGDVENTKRLSTQFEEESFYDAERRRAIAGFDGKLYFRGKLDGSGDNREELYYADAENDVVAQIVINEDEYAKPEFITVYQDQVYVKVFKSFFFPNQAIYRITEDGDKAIPAFDPTSLGNGYGLDGNYMTVHRDLLYFNAYNNEYGTELWESNGEDYSTRRVSDIHTGEENSNINDITSARDNLFFIATNEEGRHLYAYTDLNVDTKELDIQQSTITISPNPATDYVQIDWDNDMAQQHIALFNASGRLIYNTWINKGYQINVTHLANGIYYIRTETGEQSSFVKQ